MSQFYQKMGTDEKVPVEEAFEHVIETINSNAKEMQALKEEFGKNIVEWFFSGSYILCEEEEDIPVYTKEDYEADKGWDEYVFATMNKEE